MASRKVNDVQRAFIELQARNQESLDLWDPLPVQQEFHASLSRERIFMSANQCLTARTPLETPDGTFTVGELYKRGEPFYVWSMMDNRVTKRIADPVFLKGEDEAYRVTMSAGRWFECSAGHVVMSLYHGWCRLDETAIFRRLFPGVSKGQRPSRDLPAHVKNIEHIGVEQIYDFHVPGPECYLLAGLLHHNSGKTTSASVECALAFTGRHPRLPKADGKAFLVAFKGNEVGDVLFKKLFRPGAFRVIKDEHTGLWRTYKWWIDGDRASESVEAPPLIPERFIRGGWAGIGWENKKDGIPSVVRSTCGWDFRFLTAQSTPPHGVQLDLVLLDEEIPSNWYTEMMARLLTRNGLMMWSVTPQVGTPRLYSLYEEAIRSRDQENPRVSVFIMGLDDNPYLTEQQREDFKAQIAHAGEDEYNARVHGIPTVMGLRVFKEFLTRRQFMAVPYRDIPSNWTRYAVIDPGHQVCAVLFAAVPPPTDGDFIYLYDELYIKNCTAAVLAREMKKKTVFQDFEDFIIDYQGARVKDAGQGRTIISQYAEEFAKQQVSSRRSGTGFTHGISDIKAGVEAIRGLMRIRDDGTVKLRFFPSVMKNWESEIKHWNNKRDPSGGITDDPETRGAVHLCGCTRYLALYQPTYTKVEQRGNREYRAWISRMNARDKLASKHVNLGPGGTLVNL